MTVRYPAEPDCAGLVRTLKRQGDPERVHFLELLADPEIMEAVLGEPLAPEPTEPGKREEWHAPLDQAIRFWHGLGYDAFGRSVEFPLPGLYTIQAQDSAALSRGRREWVNETQGVIASWADYEAYPWDVAARADTYPIEYLSRRLPEGMGILVSIQGFLEPVMFLMGLETFAISLYTQPDLVRALFDRFADLNLRLAESLAQMDRVIGFFMGDDMGYKTSTLISPKHLRQYVFPLQRRAAEIAHRHGKLFLLHSCGDLSRVMDDLIDDVGIDAKHSFEDVIQPVEEFVAHYGDRVATIGGVDLDVLAGGTEQEVRVRTRRVLEACMPSGGYVLGTGNSVANYIPVTNYLAMLDEGRQYTRNAGH